METPRQPSAAVGEHRSGRARPRLGVALGAVAAAVASAGLVYWISAGDDPTLSAPPPARPVERRAYAPLRADAEQVVRAYEQVQEVYAGQGPTGVASFARSCADGLASDPGVLDFCLAFDIYADAFAGDDAEARAWRASADSRDLALARSALPPGQDAGARLAAVRELARQTSLQAPDAAPEPPAAAEAPAVTSAAHPRSAPAESVAVARTNADVAACRRRATAAQRTVCASPALRQADRRLRLAYRRAIAAGASPRQLARDQARFRAAVSAAAPNRAAVARLYYRRTRALENASHHARSSAG
jgi:uncharacterized protein YecT (DUF1311 family)